MVIKKSLCRTCLLWFCSGAESLLRLPSAGANFQIVRELGKRLDGFVADVMLQSFDVPLLRFLRDFDQG